MSGVVLDVIEEEEEERKEDQINNHDNYEQQSDEDSESGEEEFTPSTWNRDLTPSRSLLKSPESKSVSGLVHSRIDFRKYPCYPFTLGEST